VAVFLTELGEVVHPRKTLNVLRDEPDHRILECTLTAHAKVIVTGDRAMRALGEHKGVRRVTLRAFLGLIGCWIPLRCARFPGRCERSAATC
jgi:predicted nucleic acid-binding protein